MPFLNSFLGFSGAFVWIFLVGYYLFGLVLLLEHKTHNISSAAIKQSAALFFQYGLHIHLQSLEFLYLEVHTLLIRISHLLLPLRD